MNNLDMQIEADRTAFAPGEEILGKAEWQFEDNPQFLELSLFWRTEGKGTQDIGVSEAVRFDNPGFFGRREFRLTAPNGPYSFSGKLISIIWALEFTGPKGKNAVRKEITVSPTQQEIVCMELITDSGGSTSKGILSHIINKFKLSHRF